jgi:hypothetical protein
LTFVSADNIIVRTTGVNMPDKSDAARALSQARWSKVKTKKARREATAAARAANKDIPRKTRLKIARAATAGRIAAAKRRAAEKKLGAESKVG